MSDDFHIFFSYASSDRETAVGMADALVESGIPVWIDRVGLSSGAAWAEQIVAAIRSSAAILVLCSTASVESKNVRQELQLAWDLDRPIVPILLETMQFPDAVAYFLHGKQWIESFGKTETVLIDEIIIAVDRYGVTRQSGVVDGGLAAELQVSRATQLIGRSREQVFLHEELTQALGGKGQLVLLGGEAGIGKTSLAAAAVEMASDAGAITLTGHCYDLTNTPPYGPWLQVVAAANRLRPDIKPPVAFAAGQLTAITDQGALYADVVRYFRDLTASDSALLLLEDLHWADPASLNLLRHVANQLTSLPIMLLATYRVDELTRRNPFYLQLPTLVREAHGLRLDLKRLAVADLQHLVQSRWPLGLEDVQRLAEYLNQHAEGNPFYAVELLRALAEDGTLQESAGIALLGELDQVVMPPLLLQVIDSRVDRLGPEARTALEIAAIIGQDVALDLWKEISDLPESALFAIADQAVDAKLMDAQRDGSSVRFVHALTREALYEGVSSYRRRAWHSKSAAALMHQTAPDPDAVAFHLQAAGDPVAVEWLIKAGERAQRAYAWLTARDRFASAAELLKDQPGQEERRAWLLYRLARLMRYSDQTAGLPYLAEAARLARGAGNAALAADCRYSAAVLQWFAGDFAASLSQMEEACQELESTGDSLSLTFDGANSWLADAMPSLGALSDANIDLASQALAEASLSHRRASLVWCNAAAGRLDESLQTGDLFLAQTGHLQDVGPLVQSACGHVEQGLGIAFALSGDTESAIHHLAAAVRRYEPLDHHAAIGFTLLVWLEDIVIPYFTDGPAERRRVGAAAAREQGSAAGAFAPGINPSRALLNVWFLDGNWEAMEPVISAGWEPATYVLRRPVTTAAAALYRARGEFDAVLPVVLSVLPEGPLQQPFTTPFRESTILQLIAAETAMDIGDLDRAEAWLDAHATWLAASGSWLGQADQALTRARLCSIKGDMTQAQTLLQGARELDREHSLPLTRLQSLRLAGEIAIATGDFESADEQLQHSLALAKTCETPYEEALTLVEIARLAAATADEAVFLATSERARRIVCKLQATPALHRLDAISAVTQPATLVAMPFGLTHRETEVLKLVAQGLTDADVGKQLYISPRTVGQHLRAVYGKLGVSSRSAATRLAIEHHLA